MDANLIRALAVAVILAIAAFVAFPTQKRVERFGRRWAQEWGAFVPEALVPAFDQRSRASFRLAGLGVVVVAAAVALGLFDGPTPGPFLVFCLAALTPFLVWRVARGMPTLRVLGEGRIARGRATGFTDYLPWWSLLVVGVCAAGPLVVIAVADPARWGSGALFFAGFLQAVSGTLWAVLLWRVARASMPATDETQLYLQDAARASTMCRLVSLSAVSYLVLMQQIQLGDHLELTGHPMGDVTIDFAPFFGSAVIRLIATRRFRRRLWPDLQPPPFPRTRWRAGEAAR